MFQNIVRGAGDRLKISRSTLSNYTALATFIVEGLRRAIHLSDCVS